MNQQAEIQPALDRIKYDALVGLEYITEILEETKATFQCVLCDKRSTGNSATILHHIMSYNHRLKYLETHFPTVVREIALFRCNKDTRNKMPRILQMICKAIEDTHGRLTPSVYEQNSYIKRREICLQEIVAGRHFDEKMGCTFINVNTILDAIISTGGKKLNVANRKSDPSATVGRALEKLGNRGYVSLEDGLSALSSTVSNTNEKGDHSVVQDYISRSELRSSVLSNSSSPTSQSKNVATVLSKSETRNISQHKQESGKSILSSHDEKYKNVDDASRDKDEKKRVAPRSSGRDQKSRVSLPKRPRQDKRDIGSIDLRSPSSSMESVTTEPNKHEQNPENHPLYYTELNKFRNKRYKQLQAAKINPTTHDLKSEWTIYWTRRLKELHNENVEKKKAEFHKEIILPDVGIQTHELKEPKKKQYTAEHKLSSQTDSTKHLRKSRTPSRSCRKSTRSRSRSVGFDQDSGGYDYYGQDERRTSQRPEKLDVQEVEDERLTTLSVLRLLTALEECLGSSGPKVIELLTKAIALEKVKPNSADMLLLEDNSLIFETVKEKLKGQLIAGLIEPNKINAVRRAIRNVEAIIYCVGGKPKKGVSAEETKFTMEERSSVDTSLLSVATSSPMYLTDKAVISKEIADALIMPCETTTQQSNQFIRVYKQKPQKAKEYNEPVETTSLLQEPQSLPMTHNTYDFPSSPKTSTKRNSFLDDELQHTSLTDSNLQILLKNFKDLSTEEQQHLIDYLKKLEDSEPARIAKLRKSVNPDTNRLMTNVMGPTNAKSMHFSSNPINNAQTKTQNKSVRFGQQHTTYSYETSNTTQSSLCMSNLPDTNKFTSNTTQSSLGMSNLSDTNKFTSNYTQLSLGMSNLRDPNKFTSNTTQSSLGMCNLPDANKFTSNYTQSSLGMSNLPDANKFNYNYTQHFLHCNGMGQTNHPYPVQYSNLGNLHSTNSTSTMINFHDKKQVRIMPNYEQANHQIQQYTQPYSYQYPNSAQTQMQIKSVPFYQLPSTYCYKPSAYMQSSSAMYDLADSNNSLYKSMQHFQQGNRSIQESNQSCLLQYPRVEYQKPNLQEFWNSVIYKVEKINQSNKTQPSNSDDFTMDFI